MVKKNNNKGSEFYIDELMKKITGEKLNTIILSKTFKF